MDLIQENKVTTDVLNNKEIDSFMKELEQSLMKETNIIPTINREILTEINLASKYKGILSNIITNCMEELSYDFDFLYLDYDKNKKSYYFDYYQEGERTRQYLSKEEVKGLETKKGSIWRIWNDNQIIESEGLKENIKFSTQFELESLECKRKAGKNEK